MLTETSLATCRSYSSRERCSQITSWDHDSLRIAKIMSHNFVFHIPLFPASHPIILLHWFAPEWHAEVKKVAMVSSQTAHVLLVSILYSVGGSVLLAVVAVLTPSP